MMLEGMSASEYAYWQAYFSIEPFPQQREDRRTAEMMRAMMFAAGVKRPPEIRELVPDWWGEGIERQSPEQIKTQMRTVLATRRKKKR